MSVDPTLSFSGWLQPTGVDAAAETLRWVREFVAQPHPEVGHGGPVCPFIPGALDRSILYFRVEGEAADKAAVKEVAMAALNDFKLLEPRTGDEVRFKALLMIFPAVSAADAPQIIDVIQHELKQEFVKEGWMIGQFHPENETHGVRNPDFRPLQSPIPMLIVRIMVVEDLTFLTLDEYSAEQRLTFLYHYLDNLEKWPTKSRKERRIKEVIVAIQAIVKEIRRP